MVLIPHAFRIPFRRQCSVGVPTSIGLGQGEVASSLTSSQMSWCRWSREGTEKAIKRSHAATTKDP